MGGSDSKQIGINTINTVVAESFTQIALTCSNNAGSNQTITVGCTPPLDQSVPADQQQPYENQPQCLACMDAVVSQTLSYYNLQRATWANGGTVQVSLPIDQNYQKVVQQFLACGSKCKACVYQNISQAVVIKSLLSCQSFLNIQNVITQQLTQNVTQSLTNNQDFLAPLCQMLGASSTQQVVDNIVTRISTKITEAVIAGIQNTIQNNQVIVLTESKVTGSTQQSTFNSVTKYLSDTELFNTIFTDEQWNTIQNLYNSQNTVDSLGNAAVKIVSDLTKFASSTVGIVVLFILALVAAVFLIMAIYLIVRKIRNTVRQNQAKQKGIT